MSDNTKTTTKEVDRSVELSNETGIQEEQKREKWGQKIEFILTTLSFVVGFGNVWRFPYICYKNGGGAFLIPYFVCLVFLGIPLMILEMTLGQYSAHGTITVWRFIPLFQGIGIAMFIMVAILVVYYNTLLAWVLYYFFASFTINELSWKKCGNEWNIDCVAINDNTTRKGNASRSPADEYFHYRVLQLMPGTQMADIDQLNYRVVLCLFIAWFLIFISLSKGIKTMGKVSYLTAIFPYICLTILLIYGLTLEGSSNGLKFMFSPDFTLLVYPGIWVSASEQIFYSLGLAWGTVITLSSYNHFDNHVIRDAVIITLGNSFTSIFAGLVIFTYMGSMAHEMGVHISNVTTKGAGLAFIMYPEAVAMFPSGQIWSAVFFFMMILLGLGSQNSTLESLLTTIFDLRPGARKRKTVIVGLICFVMFCSGLIFTSQAGMYYFQLVDNYAATTSALIIGLIEVVVISWVYGVDKYMDHIKEMIGSYPKPICYWRIIWKYITPGIILVLLILSFIEKLTTKSDYNGYIYPDWAILLGWFLTMCSVSAIPVVAIYFLYRYWTGYYLSFKELTNPDIDWKTKQ